MTTITITLLRAVVEQALEALELGYDAAKSEADQYHAAMAGFRPERHAQMDADVQQIAAAITALRAALAQEQANPPGCDHCNHPLYAATKCRVCGRVTEQAEPVEPVAWVGDPSTQDYASTVPDPQVEDRLARHGIPMPEAPACPDCHGVGYDASGQTCACQENPSF